MNLIKCSIVAAASALLAARAQVAVPAPPAAEPPPIFAPEQIERKVEEIVQTIQPKVEQVARAVERAVTQVGQSIENEFITRGGGGGFRLAQGHATVAEPHPGMAGFGWAAPQQSRAVIVRTTPLDPKAAEALQEDITVMSRILEKSLGSGKTEAMGIGVWALEGVLGRPARNLYIEGHGVIFMQEAPFPLVDSSEEKPEKKEKEQTSSAWEEARRELYGPKEPLLRFGGGKAAAFDEGKVERLRQRAIEALENAAHMKSIKEDEFITIVITGPKASASSGELDVIEFEDSNGRRQQRRSVVATRRPVHGESTTMTLRARKADIDAFAAEKITLEEFQKKVKVAAY